MAIWGLTADDYTDGAPEVGGETVEIWPCNVNAVNAFVAMGTQWRIGPAGAYGLDYAVLPHVLRLTLIPRPAWAEVFESIRVLEGAALEEMHKD